MPTVELTREEATRGDLPRVCVCCGDAASAFHTVIISGWFGKKLGTLLCPLCHHHQFHWRWRVWTFHFIWVIPCVLLAVTLPLLMWEISNGRAFFGLLLLIGAYVAGPILGVSHLVFRFTGVRVSRTINASLTLKGVAPEFIEGLRLFRQEKVAGSAHAVMVLPSARTTTPASVTAMPPPPVERLSESALLALDLAIQEAQRLHQDHLGTAFFLYGLSHAVGGVAAHILNHCSIHPDQLWIEIKRLAVMGASVRLEGTLPWTPAAKRVIVNAIAEADRANRKQVDEGHLLLALLQELEGDAAQILTNLGVDLQDLRQKARWLLRTNEGIQIRSVSGESIKKME